jgi:hypothetical protein
MSAAEMPASKHVYMNLKVVWVFGLAAIVAGASLSCRREAGEPSKEAKEETKKEPGRVKTGTNDQVTVTVTVDEQKLIGLQTTELSVTQMNSEIKAYGHVLDTTGLGGLINEFQAAQVSADNSRKELDRLKMLMSQTNASERAYQSAQAAYAHDQLGSKAVLLKIQSSWGKKMRELAASSRGGDGAADVQGNLASRLATLESVLVRVEVPSAISFGSPKEARLLIQETNLIAADFFDFAPTTETQLQARGLFFAVDNKEQRLIPGMAVTALIDTGQSPRPGVVVPREAVLRLKGTTWVYVQTSESEFTRREMMSEYPVETGWFVPGEFKGGEKVVTVGAQQLLSEELKGEIGD